VSKELSTAEKQIRDRSLEMKASLTARRADVEKMRESARLASEAGVDVGPMKRLLDAALESVDVMLRAVEPEGEKPKPK
jgi:hypothetical protein